MTCTNFRCPIFARIGCRRMPGRTSGGARPSVDRVSGGRRQIYLLPTETRKAPAPISTGLRTTPVSLMPGAGRFLITSFRRTPPEPRLKCDRVHFKQKICSTPWRIWNLATFGRSTISARDRWICDVGIMPFWFSADNMSDLHQIHSHLYFLNSSHFFRWSWVVPNASSSPCWWWT